MLLTTFLCLAAQHPQWDASVQRELSLYEIVDLIDPTAAAQEALGKDLLRTTLALSFYNQEQRAAARTADAFAQSLLWMALDADAPAEQDVTEVDPALASGYYWPTLLAYRGDQVDYRFDSNSQFLEVLTTFMDPPFAESGASLKIKKVNGEPLLLGYLSEAQDAWLVEFLRLQREETQWQGQVEVTVLQGDTRGVSTLDPKERLTVLTGDFDVENLKVLYQKIGLEIVSAPSLLVLPSQEGQLSVLNEIAYISDWALETIEPGGREIADPTIDTIQEGLDMHFRVWQLDLNGFGIEVGLEYTEVARPIAVSQVDLGSMEQVFEVSNPDLRTTSVEAAVRLPDGTGLQLYAPPEASGEGIVILLTFRQVDLEAED